MQAAGISNSIARWNAGTQKRVRFRGLQKTCRSAPGGLRGESGLEIERWIFGKSLVRFVHAGHTRPQLEHVGLLLLARHGLSAVLLVIRAVP